MDLKDTTELDFKKDVQSNAIVNTNNKQYQQRLRLKAKKKEQQQEVETLKSELAELKELVNVLIGDK